MLGKQQNMKEATTVGGNVAKIVANNIRKLSFLPCQKGHSDVSNRHFISTSSHDGGSPKCLRPIENQ